MPAGRPQKKINENFFDEESKAMRYVLGASYSCYLTKSNYGILFKSHHKDLVEIIKNQLESKHAIISDTRGKSSHWIEICNRPYLYSRFQEMGLNVPKKERKFPQNIDEDYINHFARGFLDAKAGISIQYNKYIYMIMSFNNSFLTGLHEVLAEYAGVQRDKPKGDKIIYSYKDFLKIRGFIYQDVEKGLYLPSKKELFENSSIDRPPNLNTIKRSKKINKTKKLLLQGIQPKEIAEQVGYAHMTGLCGAFKRETRQTMHQWLRQNG